MPEPSRPAPLSGSEAIASSLVAMLAAIVVSTYLIDHVGGSFPPALMLALSLAVGTLTFVASSRQADWRWDDTLTFTAIVGVTFAWLLWVARPSLFPLGSGPDLTHHLLLIHYIEQHWTLVHGPGVEDYLGEMVYYTPGSHVLTALAGAWRGSTGLHVLHSVMSATVALKAGLVYVIARRILPEETPRVPLAALAAVALYASQTFFLGSFTDFSFLAQVVAELFAVAMWWQLTVWNDRASLALALQAGVTGAALFLTWPVFVGPPMLLFVALVLMNLKGSVATRLPQAVVVAIPITLVAALFIVGRTGMMMIAGTGGRAVWPSVSAYGVLFFALSTIGIAIAAARSMAGLKARTTPVMACTTLFFFVVAILLQTAGLYWFARAHNNEPYMALKMFYLLLYPQAVAVVLTIGEVWRVVLVRLKPDATTVAPGHGLAWALVASAAFFVARPLADAPRGLTVAQHPAATLPLAQAGEWARTHVPIKCVEYLVADDETAYWLHLAILGNARQGPRTGDNTTYELTPTLVRWLTPGGLPYAIADLPALPSGVRDELDIVQQFGTAAVVKRRGAASCDER